MDCYLGHPTTIAPVILNTLASKAKLRRLTLEFRGHIDLQAFRNLLKDNGNGLNGIEHICFKSCLCISSMMGDQEHDTQYQQQLLDVIATTKSALRGIEIDKAILSFNRLGNWISLVGRHHTSIEWIIFDNVWCYEYYCPDEYEYEWRLGENNELQHLAAAIFRPVPSTLDIGGFVPDTVAFIRQGKHSNLEHNIKKDGYFASNTIYSFLGKQLNLL